MGNYNLTDGLFGNSDGEVAGLFGCSSLLGWEASGDTRTLSHRRAGVGDRLESSMHGGGARRGVRGGLRGESPAQERAGAARPPKRQWSVASVQELTGQCPGYANLYSSFGLCPHALAFAHYGPMLHCG